MISMALHISQPERYMRERGMRRIYFSLETLDYWYEKVMFEVPSFGVS